MAVVVESVGVSPGSVTGNCVIVAPTGIAVGNLLIAAMVGSSASSPPTITIPTGFTLLDSVVESNNGCLSVFYKIADSGDVAASNFTFSVVGSNGEIGAMLRISGNRSGAQIISATGEFSSGSGSATITPTTVTPLSANGLLVLIGALANQAGSFSGYTCVTSPPTFTENTDITSIAGNDQAIAIATGLRAETTATGSCTITASSSAGSHLGMSFFVEDPDLLFSVSDSSTVTDSISILRALQFSINESLTLSDVISTIKKKLWSTIAKSITSWTNQSKS